MEESHRMWGQLSSAEQAVYQDMAREASAQKAADLQQAIAELEAVEETRVLKGQAEQAEHGLRNT
eukprot:503835-Lingulodinium_polyedra.AAC.1